MSIRGILKPWIALPSLVVVALACVAIWRSRDVVPAQASARVAVRPAAPAPAPRLLAAPTVNLNVPRLVEFASSKSLNRPLVDRIGYIAQYNKPLSVGEAKGLRQVLLSREGPWTDVVDEAWLKNEIMAALGRLDTPDDCYSALVEVYRDRKLAPDIRAYAIQHLSANSDRFTDLSALFGVFWDATQDVYTIPGTALLALDRLGAEGKLADADLAKLKKRVAEVIGSPDSSDVLYASADEGVRLFGLKPDMGVARDRFENARDFTAKLTAMRWIAEYGDLKDSAWLAEAVNAQPIARMKTSYALILKETGSIP